MDLDIPYTKIKKIPKTLYVGGNVWISDNMKITFENKKLLKKLKIYKTSY